MKKLIEVTQEDINSTPWVERTRSTNCPVVRAVKRAFEVAYVSCGLDSFSIGHKTYLIPPGIADIIHNFDISKTMQPFSFEVEVDDVPPLSSSSI